MPATRPSVFTKLFGRKPATARRAKPAARTQLGVTALEAREVPSVTLYNGSLYVSGTNGPDTLTVQGVAVPTLSGKVNPVLRVTDNGAVTNVARASVTGKIFASGFGGDDVISVNSNVPVSLSGGPGDGGISTGPQPGDLVAFNSFVPAVIDGGAGKNTYLNVYRQDRVIDPVLTGGRSMGPAVMAKYQALGGAAGVLGRPTEDQQSSGRFDWQHFQGGVIVSTAAGAYRVSGPVLAKYEALGGGFGVMGAPTEDVKSAGGYDWCHFEGGVLVSSGFGTFRVSGPLLAKYEALGGGFGFLGVPTEDMQSAGGYDWCHFRSGDTVGVIVSSAAGAWEVHGDNLKKYEALGGGFGWLGVPVNRDQYVNAEGWVQSDFEKGTIVWRKDVGAHMYLSRPAMISQIKATEADGVLDKNEFEFLHGCVVDAYTYMPESVRNLTKKLIDGDKANASVRVKQPGTYYDDSRWTGDAVGDLHAGDPAWKVDRLEQKWFEGKDHPYTVGGLDPKTNKVDGKTTFAYERVEGDLFRPVGPLPCDAVQTQVGDCYLMSALDAVALKHPNLIRDMFTDNGDGTFTVRFFHDGGKGADYVTVDRFVPVMSNGQLAYAGGNRYAKLGAGQPAANFPVWEILAEKAYAQLNQSDWIGQDGTNSYNGVWLPLPLGGAILSGGINGGKGGDALAHITGYATTNYSQGWTPGSGGRFKDATMNAVRAGRAVVAATEHDHVNTPTLSEEHVYYVMAVDAGGVVVANPWGHDKRDGLFVTYLSWGQFQDDFDNISSIA